MLLLPVHPREAGLGIFGAALSPVEKKKGEAEASPKNFSSKL